MIPPQSIVIIDTSHPGLIDPDIVEVIEDFLQKAPTKEIDVKLIGTLDHTASVKNPTKKLREILAKYQDGAEKDIPSKFVKQ